MSAGRVATCIGLLVIVGLIPAVSPAAAQVSSSLRSIPQPPLPDGQRIEASDGDTLVLDGDARVRVVRRRSGMVRAIYNEGQRWVVLLVDYGQSGGAGDGRVDWSYSFQSVEGQWPLPARWQGPATLESYLLVGEGPQSAGFGLRLNDGLVQMLGSGPVSRPNAFADASARVLTYRGAGGGMGGATFDDAERQAVSNAVRNAENGGNGSQMTFQSGSVGSGTFISAKVLRSIPLLDDAAVAAAKQWRYEPTMLNGRPVPVIMTAMVKFP